MPSTGFVFPVSYLVHCYPDLVLSCRQRRKSTVSKKLSISFLATKQPVRSRPHASMHLTGSQLDPISFINPALHSFHDHSPCLFTSMPYFQAVT